MSAYSDPSHYTSEDILRDGGSICVRAIRPDDRERLLRHFKELSEQSRYYRFFGMKRELSDAELGRLTELDFVNHVGLVATLTRESDERFIGVARYIRGEADRSRAEVAFAVVDEHQGRGIATVLLEHLSRIAGAAGISEFEADVLGDNNRMLEVFSKSGFRVKRASAAGVIHLAFPTARTEEFAAASQERERLAAAHSVEWILRPKSVAVIGASRDPQKIGGAIIANLHSGGFTGALYPVNREASEILGVKTFPAVDQIGEPIDLAIIAVPAAGVEAEVAQCVRAGVRAIVIVSSGFAETGDAGREMELHIRSQVRQSGMRMVGPNCMGVINTDPQVRLNATFSPIAPPRGNIAMFSQSGALGIAIFESLRNRKLGLSSFVSAGNRADISNNDLLAYWAGDPDTTVIALYLESVGNPRKFAPLARQTAKNKPIVAVKSAHTDAGTRAALGHSASLANRDLAVDAMFQQAGVIRTKTLEGLFDVVALLSSQPVPTGPRVGVVSNAGGPSVLFADACETQELTLPDFSVQTIDGLRSLISGSSSVANPLDLTAMATTRDVEKAIELVGSDANIDSVVVMYVPPMLGKPVEAASCIARAGAKIPSSKPVLSVFLSGGEIPSELSSGARGKIPVYTFPENAALALGASWRYSRWRNKPLGEKVSLNKFSTDLIRAVIARAMSTSSGHNWLSREDVATILRAAEIMILTDYSASLPLEQSSELRMTAGVTDDPTFGPLIYCGYAGPAADLVDDIAFRLYPLTDIDADSLVASLKSRSLLEGRGEGAGADRKSLTSILTRISALVETIPEMKALELNPIAVLPSKAGAMVLNARLCIESPRIA